MARSQKDRTPQKEIVKKIVRILKKEDPDYYYVGDIFKAVRKSLKIVYEPVPRKKPYIPTEEEMKTYYNLIVSGENIQHMIMLRVLLYTGVRISELVNIKIEDIDFKSSKIAIKNGVRNSNRFVLFPPAFMETLFVYVKNIQKNGAEYLFESQWKQKFTTRGVTKVLAKYATEAGLEKNITTPQLRHFLLGWLKKQGVDNSLIKPYSGHKNDLGLAQYPEVDFSDVEKKYQEMIKKFPL